VKTVAAGPDGPMGTIVHGTCTGVLNPGTGGTLTPKTIGAKLSGSIACGEVDYSAADGTYPLNGKLTVTSTEINPATTKPYQIATYVRLNAGDSLDLTNLNGIVTKGVDVGAAVGGSLWENPATKLVKTDAAWPGYRSSGYSLYGFGDLLPCFDDTTGNVTPFSNVVLGDGQSPLLNSTATGIQFTL
jgi:hypothetical protein